MIDKLKKFKYIWYVLGFTSVIVILRFDDLRGSYFPQSYKFVETRATITKSEIGRGYNPSYRINISYKYKVDNQVYHGSRVGFGFKGSRYESHVADIVKKYPKGEEVTAYYSEYNPGFSVLDPERNYRFEFNLGFIVFILVLSGSIYLTRKNA